MKALPKPTELAWAEVLIGLCERFGQLPSAVLDEDAGLLRALNLLDEHCGEAKE